MTACSGGSGTSGSTPEGDVFDVVAREIDDIEDRSRPVHETVAALLRARFGPCVGFVEGLANSAVCMHAHGNPFCLICAARSALSSLRARKEQPDARV